MNKFDELYINVLESTGYLTEEEKDIIVTEAPKLEKGGKIAIGTILAIVAGTSALVAKLIRDKKDKELINAHDELKSCNDLIQKSKDAIKSLKDEIDNEYKKYTKLKEDADRFADLFGAKTKQVYDGFYKYDEAIVNKYKTEANPDYDPKKASEWKKVSEDAVIIIKKINKAKNELNTELNKLKQYNKELKKVARKYATVDPETVNRLFDSVDKSVAAIDDSITEIDRWISDNLVKESTEDEIKLEIYESCRSGEISEEERDLLLGML